MRPDARPAGAVYAHHGSPGPERKTPAFHYQAAIVLTLCFLYWLFLAGQSTMLIRYDSITYRNLGEVICREGWVKFFATGPHREPLYPLLIATAMRVGDIFHIGYQAVLVFSQIVILTVTQLLMLRLMARLDVRPWLRLAAVGYFGVSPAVVNSALSLFSEIVVYPLVVLAVLAAARSWEVVARGDISSAVKWALATSLALTAAAFGKGIFQYVLLFVFLVFAAAGLVALLRGKRNVFYAAGAYVLAGLLIGQGAVTGYKALNYRYNGQFEFTDRYVGLLYGNAAKRAMPLNPRELWAHVVSIPGGGVCRRFFTEQECRLTEFAKVDWFWMGELPKMMEGVPPQEEKAATLRLFHEKVSSHPWRYIVLGVVEVLRLGFWESTQVGFVVYPPWLDRLYTWDIVKDGLRFMLGLLTFLGIGFAAVQTVRLAGRCLRGQDRPRSSTTELLMMMALITVFWILHAPFSVITRYAFPVVSLYIVLIVYTLDNLLARRRTSC